MKIGLFFGSFNPIHIGHLIIANYMATQTDLEQVWFVVSPHNPLKPKKTLARDRDRLNMVQNAIENNPKLKANNIEFKMPQPSYTIDTLAVLSDKYPQHRFTLIMGSDNLVSLPKWKNPEIILERYSIYVYARPNFEAGEFANHTNVKIFNAPMMDISATYIRECIQKGRSIEYLVPTSVLEYIEASRLYKL